MRLPSPSKLRHPGQMKPHWAPGHSTAAREQGCSLTGPTASQLPQSRSGDAALITVALSLELCPHQCQHLPPCHQSSPPAATGCAFPVPPTPLTLSTLNPWQLSPILAALPRGFSIYGNTSSSPAKDTTIKAH